MIVSCGLIPLKPTIAEMNSMQDLPQKLGAILGSSAFFIALIIHLLVNQQSQSLFPPFKRAVYWFLGFIVVGWILGTLWELIRRNKASKSNSTFSSNK